MHVQLLIDSIVRQTTVLIAQLATAGGARAPLSHIAGQVFVELSRVLQESLTDRGKSLWEAVFSYLGQHAVTTRAQVRERFRNDDQEQVKSVLHDLTESGLVYVSGTGSSAVYRVIGSEELGHIAHLRKDAEIDTLLWALIFREGPISRDQLQERCAQSAGALDVALERLLEQRRIRRVERAAGPLYSAPELTVGFDEPAGWEAAVWDHYQAVVQTITTKLAHETSASQTDMVGGSTYTFVVWPGHPLEEEVLSQLRQQRMQHSALRARVDSYNAAQGVPAERTEVVAYVGQCVRTGVTDEAAVGREETEEKADA